ncbi:hypothetical protein DTO002I6_9724 [Penicillium roqueforti]|nr:hypothetical protein DTO002I6_9724 [Penicillium roqueforti]
MHRINGSSGMPVCQCIYSDMPYMPEAPIESAVKGLKNNKGSEKQQSVARRKNGDSNPHFPLKPEKIQFFVS